MNLTTIEKDKLILNKSWYYFQRLIQYGYFVLVSLLFIYHTSIETCTRTYGGNYCRNYSWEEIFGYIAIGILIIYWHKHTKILNTNSAKI